jgi:hypothetical protein
MSVSSNDKPNIVQVSEDNLTVTVISSVGVPGAKGSYTVSATTPISPLAGDVWFNSDDGRTYIYYNDGNTTQWVEFGNANIGGSFGTYIDHSAGMTFPVGVTVGNGTKTAYYCQVNKFVHFYGKFTLGSTSAITGPVGLGLPINMDSAMSATGQPFGFVYYQDVSAGTLVSSDAISIGALSTVYTSVANVAGTYPSRTNASATIPFTWDTGDTLSWNLYYRAA